MSTTSVSHTADRVKTGPPTAQSLVWPHRIALFAAVLTWPLLFVGGLVTTYRVGMAVPDWPTTFGINMFLYNSWNAAWGVFIEHGHRLYGSLVGIATVVLTAWFLIDWRRTSTRLKWLAVAALLSVAIQGVLGGYRVLWNSTRFAAFHGCLGQAVFALMMTLWVMTGKKWIEAETTVVDQGRLRIQTLGTLAFVYFQIILGAWVRHFSSSLALNAHAGFALLVLIQATMTVHAVHRQKRVHPELLASCRALALLLLVQIAMGIAAWWLLRPFDGTSRFVTNVQALVRTGHQANGALVLAAATVLTLRCFRQTVSNAKPVQEQPRPLTSKPLVNDAEAFA